MIQECLVCKQEVKHRKYSKNRWFCSRQCRAITRRTILDESYVEMTRNKIKSNSEINGNGCWIWKNSKSKSGYPKIYYNKKTLRGNRVSFMVFKREIPIDSMVCHLCDTPACVNPDHLYLGNHEKNMHDKIIRRRCANGEKTKASTLTEQKVLEIRKLRREGMTQIAIAKKFDVYQTTISKIVNLKTWKHI